MRSLFDPDTLPARIMGRVFDLLALSVLWLVCAAPVVTLPAACVALHRAVRDHDVTPAPVGSFLRDVWHLLPRTAAVGVVYLAGGMLISFNLLVLAPSAPHVALLAGFAWAYVVLLVLLAVSLAYLPAVVDATGRRSPWYLVASSLYLAARHPARTALVGGSGAVVLLVVYLAPLVGLVAPGLLAWVVGRVEVRPIEVVA